MVVKIIVPVFNLGRPFGKDKSWKSPARVWKRSWKSLGILL